MIKDGSFTWKGYLFVAVVAVAGALAVHWGLFNIIAPGPKKLSKAAHDAETKKVGMIAVAVISNEGLTPAGYNGNPLLGLESVAPHA